MLHHLEHLISKRLARVIYYTRLPTGHTHEDIDACFAILWAYFIRHSVIDTFEQFRKGVENAFKRENGLICFVKDFVVVVPNYKAYYRPYLDQHLNNLHHSTATMHQWKFEAVEPSPLFPLGVKTCYKPYSSDRVVVFDMLPVGQCLSPIGALTGLEPKTLYMKWRPAPEDDTSRSVEGTHLLQGMPDTAAGPASIDGIPPADFVAESDRAIRDCMNAINHEFNLYPDVLKTWRDWYTEFAPESDSAVEYVQKLRNNNRPFHIPLKSLLLPKNNKLITPKWIHQPLERVPVNVGTLFDWPEQLVAATNSVETSLNRHPPPLRVNIPRDGILLARRNRFEEAVDRDYYREYLRKPGMTNDHLKEILRYKTTFSGETPALGGKLKQLVTLYTFLLANNIFIFFCQVIKLN